MTCSGRTSDELAELVTAPGPAVPGDASALARLQLQRIDARCARALAAGTPMGDYTRAHLGETRARIKRALEAGVEVGASTPARRGSTALPGSLH